MYPQRKIIVLTLLTFLFLALFSTLPFNSPLIKEVKATEIFASDFEGGTTGEWTSEQKGTGDTITVQSSIKKNGTYAVNMTIDDATTQNAYLTKTIPYAGTLYARSYIQFEQGLPPTTDNQFTLIQSKNGSGVNTWLWIINETAVVKWRGACYDDTTQKVASNSTPSIVLNQWYCVEIGWYYHATDGFYKVWVDEDLVFSWTSINTTRYGETDRVWMGLGSPNYNNATTLIMDSVVFADAYIGALVEDVSVNVLSPVREYYVSSNITVNFTASGGTIDKKWYNCKNASTWIYPSNTTYTTVVNMTGFISGSDYTFYAFANNTDASENYTSVFFRVDLTGYKAVNGSHDAIQDAVDLVSGTGNVYIPKGSFNFTEDGHWSTGDAPMITIPAGVNIFGAPTERDGEGQVTTYHTILSVKWEVPTAGALGAPWFFFSGNGNPNEPSRFSDIRIEGYRYINATSIAQGGRGIIFDEVLNYRVDHCYFRDIEMGAVWAGWYGSQTPPEYTNCKGVIDHSSFVNTHHDSYPTANIGYGVQLGRVHNTFWENDPLDVVGLYTDYTTFIEDCYFEKWRHGICASQGYHVVFRHNTIDYDYGFGSIDAHGTYNVVGTRAFEVYNNTFTNCLEGSNHEAVRQRGAVGIYFNNTVEGDGSYGKFVGLSHDLHEPDYALVGYMPDCPVYMWDNSLGSGVTKYTDNTVIGMVEDVNLFFSAMPDYTPYPYPHPQTLTGEGEDIPPYYTIYGSNTTIGGQPCLTSSYWQDDVGLSHNINENNNTGTFINTTTAFSSNPDWSNHSFTLNDTASVVVAWRDHANDTIDQWRVCSWQYIYVSGKVLYGSITLDQWVAGQESTLTCNWTSQGISLSFGILSHNDSGTWENRTAVSLSGLTDTFIDSFRLTSLINEVIGYKFYANNSAGTWNATNIYTLTTIPQQSGGGSEWIQNVESQKLVGLSVVAGIAVLALITVTVILPKKSLSRRRGF